MEVDYNRLQEDIRAYIKTRLDIFKLDTLEKVSQIVGIVLFAFVLALLIFAVITFSCLALIYALGLHLPMWASALVVVALWFIFMTLCIIFRKQLFINPMLAAIAAILFEEKEDESLQNLNRKEARNE